VRILAASDIHGNHLFYRRLPEVARRLKADAIVLAGDLLGYPAGFSGVEEAQQADARQIVRLLESSAVPIYFIMGNDDWVDLEPGGGQIFSLHGRRMELGQYNLVGYQYSLPFMGGIFEKAEDGIAEDLADLGALVNTNSVLVTHSPAKGVLDTTVLGTSAGSTSVFEFIQRYRIRVHVHGHIHACFGREGRHFNVAAGDKMRAMLIDIETMSHLVVDMAEKPDGDSGGR